MNERGGRPTLEELAQRLEGMQRENAQRLQALERENAELRGELAALKGLDTRQSEPAEARSSAPPRTWKGASMFEGEVSRRALLGKAGAAAVAALAAGTMMGPRQANAHTPTDGNILADQVYAHYLEVDPHGASGAIFARATGDTPTVMGFNVNTGSGVVGANRGGHPAVEGVAQGNGGTGVQGTLDSDAGATAGYGVVGKGRGDSYAGVLGNNPDGAGVWGQSSATGYEGVFGQHNGTAGYGVVGFGTGNGAGVLGRNPVGSGLRGESERGYGGHFQGGRAQLRLQPGGSAGAPSEGAHAKGELYMDSKANLFVCTAGGNPGTWKQVRTVAVS